MSSHAMITTAAGERYNLRRADGFYGGMALFAFIGALDGYLLFAHKDAGKWQVMRFRDWAGQATESIIDAGEPLVRASSQETWTDVTELLLSVQKLILLLKTEGLATCDWYDPHSTALEFAALVETLNLAKSRGAEEVLIQVS